MFVIVSTYKARVGEEDAIIALHEDWQRNRGLKTGVYLSWELLRKVGAPREFITIVRIANEELEHMAETELEHDAWYDRLVSLTEEEQTRTNYISEWQLYRDTLQQALNAE